MNRTATLLTLVLLVGQLYYAVGSDEQEAATICSLSDGRNAVYLLMPESQQPDTKISKLPVQGLTFGPTPEIELRLVGGEDLVTLDARSKELKLKEAVDRDGEEGTVKFDAIVECRSLLPDDNFKVNISVFINVQDVNDNAPVFDRPEYSFNVTEELPIDTVVFTDLLATDADSDGPNSDVRYEIVDGPFSQLLTITNPSKGVISVGRRIDFESVANFSVTVRAKDGGRPEQQSIITLQVTVLDVDDLNPVFEHDSYDATFDPDGSVRMEPGPIRARDGDTLRATIAYSLSGEHSRLFAIDGTTGQLENHGYRSPRPIVLLVHARQTDRAERQSQATVRIRLGGDGNSTDLRFTRSEYSVDVLESAKIGAVIVQVVAVGGDPTEPMTYWLVEPASVPMFALDKDTGEVRLVASLDYENRTEYRFGVQARHARQTTSATVRILVLNVNEHSPVFDQPSYEFALKGTGDSIGVVRAMDNDVGDEVHYTLLLNYVDLFTIDSAGEIHVQRPDSLGNQTYDLLVEAEDSGDPPRRSHVSVVVHASDQPVGQLLFQANYPIMALLIGLGIALLLLFVCCMLLACYVCRLRKKEALYAPHRAWRSRRLDKLILANPEPRRAPPFISEPQSQMRLPSSVAQTLQRYQDVSIVNTNKKKTDSDDSRSSSDQTYSPHGSSSPLHRDSPDVRRFGRDDDSHTMDHDRTLSISYASLALFPPPPTPSHARGADLVPVTVARSGGIKTVYF